MSFIKPPKVVKNLPRMKEDAVHLAVCRYIKSRYPEVIFNSDGAGNNLSKAQAGKNKELRSSSGYPDLFVAEPRSRYHGLYLELKRPGSGAILKDGTLSKVEHIQKQAEVLQGLLNRGYFSSFAEGYEPAIRIIDWYMSLPRLSFQQRVEQDSLEQ